MATMGDELGMTTIAAFCAVIAFSALLVSSLRKPVHAALALLVHSLALAGLYFVLSAELLAAAQVLIYSGAIVVLFIFVVALLPAKGREENPTLDKLVRSLVVAGLLAGALSMAISPSLGLQIGSRVPTTLDVGRSLFEELFLPFEMTAPLLLCAIVGAVALWRRQER